MAAPTTLTFRRATVEDVPALEPLINAAFRDDQTTQVFLSTDHETIDVVSEEVLLAKIARPDTAVLVGRLGAEGQIVGHCSIRLMEDGVTAWLSLLAVDVTRKNQGLGSQVLAHAEEYCHQTLGARRIEFDVVNTRVDLIAWYMRRGYTETGKTLPFPYDTHGDWRGVLRDDLEFIFFGKNLGVESPPIDEALTM